MGCGRRYKGEELETTETEKNFTSPKTGPILAFLRTEQSMKIETE